MGDAGAPGARRRLVLDADCAEELMNYGLTPEKVEELLQGVRHEDAYSILSKLVRGCNNGAVKRFAKRLPVVLSDPAVRALAQKYGAELKVTGGGEWRLVIHTPLPIVIHYTPKHGGSYVAVVFGSDGRAVVKDYIMADYHDNVEPLLGNLRDFLRAKVEIVRHEAELREWLRDALPGAELQPSEDVSDEVRRRLPDVEATASAIDEALSQARRQQQQQPQEAQRPPREGRGRLSWLRRLLGRRGPQSL